MAAKLSRPLLESLGPPDGQIAEVLSILPAKWRASQQILMKSLDFLFNFYWCFTRHLCCCLCLFNSLFMRCLWQTGAATKSQSAVFVAVFNCAGFCLGSPDFLQYTAQSRRSAIHSKCSKIRHRPDDMALCRFHMSSWSAEFNDFIVATGDGGAPSIPVARVTTLTLAGDLAPGVFFNRRNGATHTCWSNGDPAGRFLPVHDTLISPTTVVNDCPYSS